VNKNVDQYWRSYKSKTRYRQRNRAFMNYWRAVKQVSDFGYKFRPLAGSLRSWILSDRVCYPTAKVFEGTNGNLSAKTRQAGTSGKLVTL